MKSSNVKGKGQRPQANKPEAKKQSEGDAYFSYNMAILVGCQAEVITRDGEKYEGIFVAYSPAMEIMLEAAHLIDESYDDASISKHYDLLVIPSEKVLALKFQNVDLQYATRDFATDTAISSSRTQNSGDKELTPWDGADEGGEDLDLDTGAPGQNGWEAEEMFKKNAEVYGVVSSFNHDLSGYTTKVDKSDESFRKQEEQASQIAQEIEKNTTSWERTKVENGDDDEEATFSAVVRPGRNNNIHSSNNNNQNSVANDKYIPPSRRQQPMQQQTAPPPPVAQSHPPNNNGQSQMNNNNGNNRKAGYGQNQNPRNNYAPITNNVYHHERGNYDTRRRQAPHQNQYGHSGGGHGDGPGRRMEDGNRQARIVNKTQMERGGDRRGERGDSVKLKEFSSNFRLQTAAETPQNRRIAGNQQNPHTMNMHGSSAPPNATASLPGRNPSPPSNNAAPPPPAAMPPKVKKEEFSPVPPPQQVSAPVNIGEVSSIVNTNNNPHPQSYANHPASTPTNGNAVSNTPAQMNPNVRETTPPNVATVPDSQQTPSTGDPKSVSDADAKFKKKFTFNPDAKEFAPAASKSFTPRSPSTPPRPPSTPATSSTPQLMTAAPFHPIMPLPMPMLYAPPPYTHAPQTALTPPSNSSASSGGTTPRHGGHRKGSGMLGVPPRSEMTPPMQMATGPPLLTPASIQAAAPPAQYAFVPPGPYSQVMRVVPPNMMTVYQSEAGGATQMHPPMHYLHHNGASPQNNPGHPQNNSQSSNPSAQSSVVPANGHGYGQSGGGHGGPPHMGFPYVSVPVVGVSYPHGHGPPHTTIMTVPYVSHQGGGTAVIPQSQ